MILLNAEAEVEAQLALGKHTLELPKHKEVVWKTEDLPKVNENQGLAQLKPSRSELPQADELSDNATKELFVHAGAALALHCGSDEQVKSYISNEMATSAHFGAKWYVLYGSRYAELGPPRLRCCD